jgi:hypothetical protein
LKVHEPTADKPSIVPFPKFFAVIGYALVALFVMLVLLETASWVGLTYYRNYWHSRLRTLQANAPPNLYACRGTGNAGCPLFAEPDYNIGSASPVYDGYSWSEEFWKEYRLYTSLESSPPPYEPFRLWGLLGFHGQYINNDDTAAGLVRRTVNRQSPGCDMQHSVKVWFFGGSTAWGEGVPDFATVPSYLSEKLNAPADVCAEVTNLGVDAYGSNLELIYLIQELKAGLRPNVVIFYDGINDTIAGAYDPAQASTHLNYTQIKQKFESPIISWPGLARRSHLAQLGGAIGRRLSRRHAPPPSAERWPSLAQATLNNYENNLQLAYALGKAYGFEVFAFWQPHLLYGNKPHGEFEKMLVGQYGTETFAASFRAVYGEAERRSTLSRDFTFLGRLFDGISDPLFIDDAHLGPRGNEIAAEAIARVVSSSPLIHGEKHGPH